MHGLRARPPRRWASLLVLVFTAASLTGCVRVHSAMAVSSDDRVSGRVVAGAAGLMDDTPLTALTVPADLTDRVTAQPYRADGYVGTELSFDDLSFDEMRELATSVSSQSGRYQLHFRRSGGLVAMSGSVDLSEVSTDRADVIVKISFPGTITSTDGKDDNGTVTWNPKPGQITPLSVTAEYSSTPTTSFFGWTTLVVGLALGAAVVVTLLAFGSHRRARRTAEPV